MDDFRLDFAGIGAAKAGTTWLAACLSEHPEVCMSNPKELNYFCAAHIWETGQSEYRKGQKWLRKRFPGYRPGQLRGEFSVSYLVDPQSPTLIRRHHPAAKLIVSFRNPTDALYSLYFQKAKEYSVSDTFEAFLEHHPEYVRLGFYYSHMTRYLECFPAERIHTVLYDDIHAEPRQVLASLFEFLDVDSAFEPSSLSRRVNVSAVPRSLVVRDAVADIVEFFRTDPVASHFKETLNQLGVHHIANWILRKNLRAAKKAPMAEDVRERLLDAYRPHNQLLGNWLGRDLSHWNQ